MKRIFSLFLAFFVLMTIALAQDSNTSKGPENGHLMIIGGGRLSPVFYEQFMELAGGKNAPIVVIPTAGGENFIKRDPEFKNLKKKFAELGFTNVTVRHTWDRTEANSAEFTAAIEKAKGVWITGGRQWRLADSYLDTKTHKAFWKVLDSGGVIAGSSAGATIQGSYLARGDTKANTIMMGDHEEGFGFVSNIAIDQHVLARNRQFDLFEITEKLPQLLGLGLDENTGVIVRKNTMEVIGESFALIYDGSFWNGETSKKLDKNTRSFYLLKAGMLYDLKARKVIDDIKDLSKNPEDQINEVYTKFSEAYKTYDSKLVESIYDPSTDYLSPGQEIKKGIDSFLPGFQKMFENAKKDQINLNIEFDIINRNIEGNLAYDIGYYHLSYTDKNGNQESSVGKFITILKKQTDQSWKFVVDGYSQAPIDSVKK